MAGPLIDPEDRYPEELETLALQMETRLGGLGVTDDDAQRIAWEVAEHLRRFWGGHKKYVRAQRARDASQLDLLGGEAGEATDNPILVDLGDQVTERLVAIGHAPDEATTMGLDVASHVRQYWGTGDIYICKGLRYEISLRDQEIYRRCNSRNYEWLATEYDLTVQRVYAIVKRIGVLERQKRQGALFQDAAVESRSNTL